MDLLIFLPYTRRPHIDILQSVHQALSYQDNLRNVIAYIIPGKTLMCWLLLYINTYTNLKAPHEFAYYLSHHRESMHVNGKRRGVWGSTTNQNLMVQRVSKLLIVVHRLSRLWSTCISSENHDWYKLRIFLFYLIKVPARNIPSSKLQYSMANKPHPAAANFRKWPQLSRHSQLHPVGNSVLATWASYQTSKILWCAGTSTETAK